MNLHRSSTALWPEPLRLFCAILACLSLFCCIAYSADLADKISLKLRTEKSKFVWGENIWLEVAIENLEAKPIVIPAPTQMEGLGLILVDGHGNRISPSIDFHSRFDSVLLGRNEIRYVTVSLANYVTDTTSGGRPGGGLIVGNYSVEVVLGDVRSNSVDFTVEEPSAGERIVAERLMKEVIRWTSPEHAIQACRDLIRTYPNSVYLPNVYAWLMLYLRASGSLLNRGDELMRTALDYMDRFPESGGVLSAISRYEDGLINKLGYDSGKITREQWKNVDKELENLKAKHPTSRVSRAVDEFIDLSKRRRKVGEK